LREYERALEYFEEEMELEKKTKKCLETNDGKLAIKIMKMRKHYEKTDVSFYLF
jgi:hypothetical protein